MQKFSCLPIDISTLSTLMPLLLHNWYNTHLMPIIKAQRIFKRIEYYRHGATKNRHREKNRLRYPKPVWQVFVFYWVIFKSIFHTIILIHVEKCSRIQWVVRSIFSVKAGIKSFKVYFYKNIHKNLTFQKLTQKLLWGPTLVGLAQIQKSRGFLKITKFCLPIWNRQSYSDRMIFGDL